MDLPTNAPQEDRHHVRHCLRSIHGCITSWSAVLKLCSRPTFKLANNDHVIGSSARPRPCASGRCERPHHCIAAALHWRAPVRLPPPALVGPPVRSAPSACPGPSAACAEGSNPPPGEAAPAAARRARGHAPHGAAATPALAAAAAPRRRAATVAGRGKPTDRRRKQLVLKQLNKCRSVGPSVRATGS